MKKKIVFPIVVIGFFALIWQVFLKKASTPPKAFVDGGTMVFVSNTTGADSHVYVNFGSDSVVLPGSWSFCKPQSNLSCDFALGKHERRMLPIANQYLNATISFDKALSCNVTKAELNVNNPKWYDTLDVSLVDGYSNNIAITIYEGSPAIALARKADGGVPSTTLGPPNGKTGNEKVYGLFPYGCDICTARQSPPCGISQGTDGCKSGTQYKPDVPCQYQGPNMGGGGIIATVELR